MSHNLNFSETLNRLSFFSVRQKAWHNGMVLDDYPTAEEAIVQSGCDFLVKKKPVTVEIDGIQKHISNRFATYRTDTRVPFGVVGSTYKVIQNRTAFSFFDQIVGKGEAKYETAGCLHDGQVVFVTVKLPDHITVQGKDVIEKYLFLVTYHDGTGPLMAALTPVRIVCNNTLNAALRNMEMKITIRHTTNYQRYMEEAPKVMGIVNQLTTELQDVYNMMARTKLVDSELKQLILRSLGTPATLNKMDETGEVSKQLSNKVEQVLEYVFTAESQQMETTKGTVWGAYNAITGYLQNVKQWENTDNQLDSILRGNGSRITQRAFDLCMEKLK